MPQATPNGETIRGSSQFSDVLVALKDLQNRIEISLQSTRSNVPARDVVGSSRGADSIQSDRAPIMKLLNHELVGYLTVQRPGLS